MSLSARAGIHETNIPEGAWHETYEVVSYVWILFGLAYVSLVIKYISDLLISKAKKVERSTVRRLEVSTCSRGRVVVGESVRFLFFLSAPSTLTESDSY